MPTIGDLLSSKGTTIHSIPPSATVLQAIQRMNQHQLGALVVMQDEQVVGMFTERDVMRRVVGQSKDPRKLTVGAVMTREVISCPIGADVEHASRIMQERRIRHLPVTDDHGSIHGLVSIGDLNAYYANSQAQTINSLTDYIYGRA